MTEHHRATSRSICAREDVIERATVESDRSTVSAEVVTDLAPSRSASHRQ